jgi:hypothetical protein
MRNRIWTELSQAKHNEEFATVYAEQQRKNLKYFDMGVLIFSTGGIMGWPIWNGLSLVSCVIISAVSLLRLLQPHIIMTEKQISNIDAICKFYINYYNELERLWFDNEQKSQDTEAVKSRFFEIKQSESELTSLISETIRTKPKRLIKIARENSINYLKMTFNP